MPMSEIRIGTITFDWYPYDLLVRRLAGAAIDRGYQVDVICLRRQNEAAFEICDGVRIYRLPMIRGFGSSLPSTILNWCWFLLLASIFVTKQHIKQRYDVIHVHNMPDFLVFAALMPKLLGAKVILHVQDVSPELMAAKAKGSWRSIVTSLATWQEYISTSFADSVVTVGWPFQELLLKRGVPEGKITILLNSADPKLFPASRRLSTSAQVDKERPFILMYHGTLAERNGLDTAIRALAIARQSVPQLRLDILGRGEALPELKELASQLGISEHVIFINPCPSDEIVDFVVHGDVGIIPYRHDGFMNLVLPTKAYEFAWMHRPMIASDTPAIRSMFQPGSISLCDPSSPESFAEAIIDLYQNAEKRTDMVASAANDYRAYQWEEVAERYRLLIATLCQTQVEMQKQSVARG